MEFNNKINSPDLTHNVILSDTESDTEIDRESYRQRLSLYKNISDNENFISNKGGMPVLSRSVFSESRQSSDKDSISSIMLEIYQSQSQTNEVLKVSEILILMLNLALSSGCSAYEGNITLDGVAKYFKISRSELRAEVYKVVNRSTKVMHLVNIINIYLYKDVSAKKITLETAESCKKYFHKIRFKLTNLTSFTSFMKDAIVFASQDEEMTQAMAPMVAFFRRNREGMSQTADNVTLEPSFLFNIKNSLLKESRAYDVSSSQLPSQMILLGKRSGLSGVRPIQPKRICINSVEEASTKQMSHEIFESVLSDAKKSGLRRTAAIRKLLDFAFENGYIKKHSPVVTIRKLSELINIHSSKCGAVLIKYFGKISNQDHKDLIRQVVKESYSLAKNMDLLNFYIEEFILQQLNSLTGIRDDLKKEILREEMRKMS